MPVQPRCRVAIPQITIPDYVFENATGPLPNKPLIIDAERPDDRFLTLASYRRWSQCMAMGMRDFGLQSGGRVLFISGNSFAWPICYMGTIMAGGIFAGVGAIATMDHLKYMASRLEPTIIIASHDGIDKAVELADFQGMSSESVFLFDPEDLFTYQAPQRSASYRSWTDIMPKSGETFDWSPYCCSPFDTALIVHTSGSTGPPKGVMITHGNVVANAVQCFEQYRDLPSSGTFNWLSWASAYHSLSTNHYAIVGPKSGAQNYIIDEFSFDKLFRFTEKYRPTWLMMLPHMIIDMLSNPLARKYDLSSLTNVIVAGAPLRQSVTARFEAFMPNEHLRVVQGFGMSETTSIVLNRHWSDRSSSSHAGELVPNAEAKIVDVRDGETELHGPFQGGDLWIRAPNVTRGYWRDPESTAKDWTYDGWLKTGNYAFYDEQHRFFVRDRVGDFLNPPDAPAGTAVLPTDLESAIVNVPGVNEAVVLSVKVDDLDAVAPVFDAADATITTADGDAVVDTVDAADASVIGSTALSSADMDSAALSSAYANGTRTPDSMRSSVSSSDSRLDVEGISIDGTASTPPTESDADSDVEHGAALRTFAKHLKALAHVAPAKKQHADIVARSMTPPPEAAVAAALEAETSPATTSPSHNVTASEDAFAVPAAPHAFKTVPRAFVVLDRASGVTREDVVAAYDARVAKHERMAGGVFVIDAIPTMPGGKIDRNALRAVAAKAMAGGK